MAAAPPRIVPKAIRLMLTALRISSIDMRTSTPFLRASTPYTPAQKSTADSTRNWASSTSVPPSQDDGADEGGEEHDRYDLEGNQVGREEGVTDGVGALGGDVDVVGQFLIVEVFDDHVGEDAEEDQRGETGDQ